MLLLANESLKRLKDTLIQTKKYTGLNINTDSLDKLRTSVNQMTDVMNQTRPGDPNTTVGNISGTTCGSFVNTKYTKPTVSLGELEEHVNKMPIEACSSVVAAVCNCVNRTFLSPCDCENRTLCLCSIRELCNCHGRTYSCNCKGDCSGNARVSCECRSRCECNARGYSDCPSRTACEWLNAAVYTCSGRENQPLCPCNGRCSCNTEKRFT